ncbi:hypothetical protein [Streptomyces albicerus]|uniref:hypothetical protein n=1 Tax=Streptomyces albicerus TaxID=2569859 RepID=UPI001CEDCA27|nr:hypothetical protein [Streptomyces albicerus]
MPAKCFNEVFFNGSRTGADLAMDIMGRHGQVPLGRPRLRTSRTDDPGAANSSASWSTTYLIARSGTLYAGTSQVRRNILAEKVLGLSRAAGLIPRRRQRRAPLVASAMKPRAKKVNTSTSGMTASNTPAITML